MDGLSKREYRGYDSAGLAVRDGEALAQVVKAKGRLSDWWVEKADGRKCVKRHLQNRTYALGDAWRAQPDECPSPMCTEIAADQGSGPVESEVVGVHNGIIENYAELKEKLLKHGYTFYR